MFFTGSDGKRCVGVDSVAGAPFKIFKFFMSPLSKVIHRASMRGGALQVAFKDSVEGVFHPSWLVHNCQCVKCKEVELIREHLTHII